MRFITREEYDANMARCRALEVGWIDDYISKNTSPPPAEILDYVDAMMRSGAFDGLSFPWVVPTTDGVQLEWWFTEWDIEVRITKESGVEFIAFLNPYVDVDNEYNLDLEAHDTPLMLSKAVRMFAGEYDK